MQPLQCDLQPAIQQANRTTHKWTTTRCRTPWENQSRVKTNRPHPPHTRATCHRRLQPLYTAKHKVSCLWLPPQHKSHARCMQPLQCDLQPVIQQANRTTHKWTTTRCRTPWENQSHVKTNRPHPPHTWATCHPGCSHFTRQNTRFRAPASSPTQVPR